MLKIKDNVDLDKLEKDYNLEHEFIDDDYDITIYTDLVYDKDGVFISSMTKEIYGRDNDTLDLLYDLIKADLVEKAGEIYKNRNTCKYKKRRFMEDKSTSDLMYETLVGGDE